MKVLSVCEKGDSTEGAGEFRRRTEEGTAGVHVCCWSVSALI